VPKVHDKNYSIHPTPITNWASVNLLRPFFVLCFVLLFELVNFIDILLGFIALN
jgi:hypothetical protein